MGDLFQQLGRRVDANARRAVEVYRRELADYRALDVTGGGPAAMLDFAVTLRRRTVALAAAGQPFTDDDLRYMESVGEERGERRVSAAAQRQVLMLHSTLTLQEIHEAAGPDDIDEVMRMLRWLGPQGITAQDAYTRGFLAGQRRAAPFASRVQRLALMLARDDDAAADLARDLAMDAGHRLVTVVTIHGDTGGYPGRVRAATVEALLHANRVPMMWREPAEFVVLTPTAQATAPIGAAEQALALSVVRNLADALGRPCSVGAAAGRAGHLAGSVDLARRVSRAAPVQARPDHLHTLADVFVELAVAQLPEVDGWLDDLVRRLATGPDLIGTLAVYYRNDMSRLRTAAALNIHPRTLDYRIRRAQDLAGFHPATTRGVRLLGAGIARALARESRQEVR
ncbi:PucR family transcriptional regulator [Rhizomonospora bruguierae]|uniref:PucR family transcriptional regulator n=1 Tax=Rhizomonospora bruguierae TaxID=1581705 RepID=UPI001BCDE1E1|nr:helix-turn-helix domain-containing protein [Micromonospora sp. NBRC 107566]